MKKQLLFFLAIFCFGVSCNEDGGPLAAFLNTDQLPSAFYDINIDRDTVLHTRLGAEIQILRGSVTAGNKKVVRLEIKEAYAPADIVKAGLLTKSGNRLLSSGGMIYIQTKDEGATIVKSIGISMPSDNVDAGMQLFKGNKNRDGNIDWTDPQPLQPNKTIDSIIEGKGLFQTNCLSCHDPLKDATGPPFVFLTQRRDKKWMNAFIRNSASLIASGDPRANCLYEQYNKTAMTAFPKLTDDELEKIYRYMDDVSKNLDPAKYPDHMAGFDSCVTYIKARTALLQKRDSLIYANGPEVEHVMLDTGYHILVAPNNLVVPKNSFSTYYKFNITTFGWYNVDVFADTLPGYEASILKATLKGNIRALTNIYIVVPEAKIFVAGGLLAGEENTYGFYTDDGKLPLPQGKQAYILAFTEKGDNIVFGLTPFTIAHDNNVAVQMSVITKQEMNNRIKNLNFKDLTINAADAPNANVVRKVDIDLKHIESLKPRSSDCSCFPLSESETEDSGVSR